MGARDSEVSAERPRGRCRGEPGVQAALSEVKGPELGRRHCCSRGEGVAGRREGLVKSRAGAEGGAGCDE